MSRRLARRRGAVILAALAACLAATAVVQAAAGTALPKPIGKVSVPTEAQQHAAFTARLAGQPRGRANAVTSGNISIIVICGITINQSVTLKSDLNCSGTNGLTLGKSGVTLNLNGYSINGDFTPGTEGVVAAEGVSKVTVENGTVAAFDAGINMFDVSSAKVTAVNAHDNLEYGMIVVGDGGQVTNSTAANELEGIVTSGIIVVKNNHVLNNQQAGIDAAGGTTVTGNIAYGNGTSGGGEGIVLGGPGNSVSGNTADNNAGFGIYATNPDQVDSGTNRAQDNGGGASADGSFGHDLQCYGVVC